MTNTALDELRALSAKNMAEAQAKADVYRPDTRPEWTKITANVKVMLEDRTGQRKDGSDWSQKVVCLHLGDAEILETFRGKVPASYRIAETTYDINYAERAKSALGYTVKSIADLLGDEGASIVEIDNKRVTFEEKVIPAPKDKNGETVKDKGGYALKPTFYLAVVGIEGAKAKADPTDNTKLIDMALAFATGKTRGEFQQGLATYLKEQNVEMTADEQLWMLSKFVPEMTKQSRLGLDAEQKFVLL